jgi:selenide,water dikinase
LENSFLTKAHRTNAEYTTPFIDVSNLDHLYRLLIHDPQTSGGLLLSVSSAVSHAMVMALRAKFESAEIVGEVLPRQDKAVVFE